MASFSRPPVRVSGAVATAVVALSCTSCGGGSQPQAYCVDQNQRVVSNDFCDSGYHHGGGGGLFFIYTGARIAGAVSRGTVLSGGTRVDPRNPAARARAGLPRSGAISGTRGGFGAATRGRSGTGHGFGRSFGG